MEDCLDTTYEITKLIKKSPKRETIFRKLAEEIQVGSPGIRTLCPTRWTVRAEALASISENYQVLQATWDAARQASRDTEMRARIIGVASQMEKFDYFLELSLEGSVYQWSIIYLDHFKQQRCPHVKAKVLSRKQSSLFN